MTINPFICLPDVVIIMKCFLADNRIDIFIEIDTNSQEVLVVFFDLHKLDGCDLEWTLYRLNTGRCRGDLYSAVSNLSGERDFI